MADPRARVTTGELVVVLSHYDLGVIESVSRHRGGSRQSPKVLIVSDRGRFLLKRRAEPPGLSPEASVQRLAFSHEIARRLAEEKFPIAELVPAKQDGRTAVRIGSHVYELFRFVQGERYDRRPDSAYEGGHLLGRFHAILAGWSPGPDAPTGTFHNRAQFAERLQAARDKIDDPRCRPVIRGMGDLYAQGAEAAERLGVSREAQQIIHSDWHPGNMIFRAPPGHRIAAVVDLDSARMGPAIVDVANGALQFAAMRSYASPDDSRADEGGVVHPHDPHAWRIALDPVLFAAFCAGYRSSGCPALETAQNREAVPWLMAEAIIVEAVLPVANTGVFGRLEALPLLALVEKTASSIITEKERLVTLAAGS